MQRGKWRLWLDRQLIQREVVTGEVRERCSSEVNPGQAVLRKGMAAGFNDHIF